MTAVRYVASLLIGLAIIGCSDNQHQDPAALFEKARMAEDTGDYNQAFALYEKASDAGFGRAHWRVASTYDHGYFKDTYGTVLLPVEQDQEKAGRYFQRARVWAEAMDDDNEAIIQLAGMYYDGKGVARDQDRAIELYRRAADAGDAAAQYAYAYAQCWSAGRYAEGLNWIERSAEQGYAPAEYLLHTAYRDGRGVEQNFETARMWLERPAARGYPLAVRGLRALTASH